MLTLKACIIGAGSTYTPELIEGFIQRWERLPFSHLTLMDIDPDKLQIVGGLAQRMVKKSGLPIQVAFTHKLEEALVGANYVFAQIRVGGLQARIRDEKIPLKYGLLGQETTGAGGFMNALRTVPVMLDIARKMETLCPDAWLINFSNPSGIVAQALLVHSKIKMVGLCNNPVNMLRDIEETINTREFDYDYVGLNHLSWITSVRLAGEDILNRMDTVQGTIMKNVPQYDFEPALREAVPGIPCSYLSYFFLRGQQLKRVLEAEKTRGEVIISLENSLLKQYQQESLAEKPKELESRGGALYSTAAVSLAEAIYNKSGEYHVVNTLNHGALPFMADDDAVEVKCQVGERGLFPVPVKRPQHLVIIGLMQAVKAYERLTVEAAITGNRSAALAAMLVHPLMGDYQKCLPCLEEMLEANRDYLPAFF